MKKQDLLSLPPEARVAWLKSVCDKVADTKGNWNGVLKVATMISVHRSTVRRWVNGKTGISDGDLLLINAALQKRRIRLG